MRIKHHPKELGGVLIGEAPYVTGEASSMADIPDEMAQALGEFLSNSGIEFEAKCPDCGTEMEMWQVPYEQFLVVEILSTGYRHRLIGHQIFLCPKCGYTRDRKLGDEDNKKIVGICVNKDEMDSCSDCRLKCAYVKR